MFRHIDIEQYTSDLLSCTYNGGSYILVCIHISGVPVLLGCRRNCCQLGVHLQPPWYIRSFDVLDERIFSWGNIFHGAWASSTSERLLARWYNCRDSVILLFYWWLRNRQGQHHWPSGDWPRLGISESGFRSPQMPSGVAHMVIHMSQVWWVQPKINQPTNQSKSPSRFLASAGKQWNNITSC